MVPYDILPAWRAAALFHLGQPVMAREEAQRFLNGIRSFWVGSSAPTDEAVVRWVLQAHPISVTRAVGNPARRIAWRRASCRGYRPAIPSRLDFSGTEADRVVADAFGMHPELFIFRDHRIHAVEQTLVERRQRIGRAGLD